MGRGDGDLCGPGVLKNIIGESRWREKRVLGQDAVGDAIKKPFDPHAFEVCGRRIDQGDGARHPIWVASPVHCVQPELVVEVTYLT